MKIKRTFAPSMREALNLVKLEQGDDAVILGNNKVPGGVEIISAIDYDQVGINAELISQRKQQLGRIDNNQNKLETYDAAPTQDKVAETSPKSQEFDLSETANHRQEPILGSFDSKPLKKRDNKIETTSYWGNPDSISNQNNDFSGTNKQLSENQSNQEFDGKQHAEDLLNSIKDLQSQLTEVNLKNSVQPDLLSQANVSVEKNVISTEEENITFPSSKNTESHKNTEFQNTNTVQQEVMQDSVDEMKDEMRHMRLLMQSQLASSDWKSYRKQHPMHSVLLNLLTELGIGADICERVINQIDQIDDNPQMMWRKAIGILAKLLPPTQNSILDEGGIVALVGSTGVGKTTTIAKIAARYAHAHSKREVALISTDNFRIGAQEQLQQYAKLLQIPLLTANNSDELADRLDMLSDKTMVLIDTAGVSQNDMRLSEQFHNLQQGSPQIQPLLVLSANTQLAALDQTIKNFEKVRLAGSVVTKIDEAASLGGVLTTSIRHHLPINFCGLGQQVPEDLETAKSHRLISKAVTLMQQYKETPNIETMSMRFNKMIAFNH